MTLRLVFKIAFMTINFSLFGQRIERSYIGFWGSTYWFYDLHKNGQFNWHSEGHFGYEKLNGHYKIEKDTLILFYNKRKRNKLSENKYIIDGDSCIIDINLTYDYCTSSMRQTPKTRHSRERTIKFPQVNTNDPKKVNDLLSVLDSALNYKEVKKYFHFSEYTDRKLILTSYFSLDDKLILPFEIDGHRPILKPKILINERFYIDILRINQNTNSIIIEFKINNEGVKFYLEYKRENGKWQLVSKNEYY